MNLSRRSFFGGLATTLVAATAIIRTPGLLMPVKSLRLDRIEMYKNWLALQQDWERYSMPYREWRYINTITEIITEAERNVI